MLRLNQVCWFHITCQIRNVQRGTYACVVRLRSRENPATRREIGCVFKVGASESVRQISMDAKRDAAFPVEELQRPDVVVAREVESGNVLQNLPQDEWKQLYLGSFTLERPGEVTFLMGGSNSWWEACAFDFRDVHLIPLDPILPGVRRLLWAAHVKGNPADMEFAFLSRDAFVYLLRFLDRWVKVEPDGARRLVEGSESPLGPAGSRG
eukprot:jgi/Mesvir1/18271/Mv09539-RA.1